MILICIKPNSTMFYIILIHHNKLLLCNKVLCDVKDHVIGMCILHDDIISVCLDASDIIPETGKTKKIGHIHIAELFSNKYNELCNSVRDEQQSLIINMISKHIVLMMKIMIIYV